VSDIQGARAIGLVDRGAIRELTHARTFEVDGSQGDTHVVTITARFTKCTCEAGRHDRLCYHVRAARLLLAKERASRG
jgi:uncharacterized Zn finger protein